MDHEITQISQAKRNTERVNIYLNGKFWIGLDKTSLVSLQLYGGKKLSELEKQEIEETSSRNKIMDRAYNYSQSRPHSRAEVKDYLVLKKGISEEEAEDAIKQLENRGLLSDEKFAQWYVDYKLDSGANGVNKIKAKLLQKRVSIKIITAILEKLNANDEFKATQAQKIKNLAEKLLPTIKAKDSYELKAKLMRRLMSKGFTYDEIKKAIKT